MVTSHYLSFDSWNFLSCRNDWYQFSKHSRDSTPKGINRLTQSSKVQNCTAECSGWDRFCLPPFLKFHRGVDPFSKIIKTFLLFIHGRQIKWNKSRKDYLSEQWRIYKRLPGLTAACVSYSVFMPGDWKSWILDTVQGGRIDKVCSTEGSNFKRYWLLRDPASSWNNVTLRLVYYTALQYALEKGFLSDILYVTLIGDTLQLWGVATTSWQLWSGTPWATSYCLQSLLFFHCWLYFCWYHMHCYHIIHRFIGVNKLWQTQSFAERPREHP